jgi:hypothetical protein
MGLNKAYEKVKVWFTLTKKIGAHPRGDGSSNSKSKIEV